MEFGADGLSEDNDDALFESFINVDVLPSSQNFMNLYPLGFLFVSLLNVQHGHHNSLS